MPSLNLNPLVTEREPHQIWIQNSSISKVDPNISSSKLNIMNSTPRLGTHLRGRSSQFISNRFSQQ